MKTLVIGDIHGRSVWKDIIEQETPDKVIFIGDYLDSFYIHPLKQLSNLKDIIEFKKTSNIEVILLLGNHDYHYLDGILEYYSGYKHQFRPTFENTLMSNIELFDISHQMGNILFTHAGVSETWYDSISQYINHLTDLSLSDKLNILFKDKPNLFKHGNYNSYGDDVRCSPIWIRPKSLIKNNSFLEEYIQVVGHTNGVPNLLEPNYYFIDVLDTINKFLLIENNEIKWVELQMT
jgi:predicted MPP superfamily phosphohydrolase